MAPDLTTMNSAPLTIAAGLAGLMAMAGLILRGLRAERDLVCPGRAEREAAEAWEVMNRPTGAGRDVVGQRGVLEDSRN